MAERKPAFLAGEGFSEEMAITDTATFGGLTLSGDIAMAGNEVTGLPTTPSGDTAAASKAYVDAVAAGLNPKNAVRVRAQGNIALAAPGATVDGITMAVDDRFLADLQTTTTEDGFYLWKGAATPAVRTPDAQVGVDFSGVHTFIKEGTDDNQGFVCTNDKGAGIIGTDDLDFTQFTGAVIPDATSGSGGAVKGKVTFDSDKGLLVVAGVAEARIDAVTLDFAAGVMEVTGLPALFEVGGVATGATVTAPNLDTLTDGSNADALHAHAIASAQEAERIENTLTTATDTTADADPVYQNGNDTIGLARADDDVKSRVVGIIRTGAGVAPQTPEVVSAGPCAAILTAATFNTPYYLQAAGGIGTALPGAGSRLVLMGYAKNATDLWVRMVDYGKKAA